MRNPQSSTRAHTRVSLALVVALGVGATLAITTVLHRVFFGAGAFTDIDRLVVIENTGAYRLGDLDGEFVQATTVSWPDYRNLRDQQHSFATMGGLTRPTREVWEVQDRRRSVQRVQVDGDLLRMTGARPVLGRVLDATDLRDDAVPVATITASLWRRQLGADARVLDGMIRVDGQPFTLVGIIPDEAIGLLRERKELFDDGEDNEYIITPLVDRAGFGGRPEPRLGERRRNSPFLMVVGKLRPGVSIHAAQEDVAAIGMRLADAFPATNSGRGMSATTWSTWRTRSLEHLRPMLWGAALLAILVAGVSALGLVFADSIRRGPEMAIRYALGATPSRLGRLVLARSVLWTLPGGLIAIALASATLWWIDTSTPQASVPGVNVSPLLLVAAVALTLVGGLALGLVGVWLLGRGDVTRGLGDAGRGISLGRGRSRAFGILLTVQVGASTSLGVVSALLMHSMLNVVRVDLGFDPDRSFVVPISLPQSSGWTAARRLEFVRSSLERVRLVRGVERAGVSDAPVLSRGAVTLNGTIALEAPGQAPKSLTHLIVQHISPGYLEALGIEVVRGRLFTEDDYLTNAPSLLVSESFYRSRIGGTDPLSTRVRLGSRVLDVIGVVRDALQSGPTSPAWETVYLLQSNRRDVSAYYIVVSPSGAGRDVMHGVVAELARTDRDVVVDEPRALDALLWKTVSARHRTLWLVASAAVVVLLLTAFSVSGALGEFVESRRRDIAIRKAVGADKRHIRLLLIRHLATPCGAGVLLGCLGGWLLTRTLSSHLFGVSAADPLTISAAIALELLLGFAAAAGPLARANGIDAATALRAS
jgi:putative ABC transport system permease protein